MAGYIVYAINDFTVEWQGDAEKTQEAILFNLLFLSRVRKNKSCILVLTGPPGEGKSLTLLSIQDVLYKKRYHGNPKYNFENFVLDAVMMTPLDYAEKLPLILSEKSLRKVFTVHIDEARQVVGSGNWQSFLNQAVGHVNATSRAVKPLLIGIVTQDLMDIDKNTRRSINYQFKCVRSGNVEVVPYKFYQDDRNPEKPMLKKRRVVGTIVKDGETQKVKPVFVFKKARDELVKPYDKIMVTEKTNFINKLMSTVLDKIKQDLQKNDYSRVYELADYFCEHQDVLKTMAGFKRKKWRLNPDTAQKFNLTIDQKHELERELNDRFDKGRKG